MGLLSSCEPASEVTESSLAPGTSRPGPSPGSPPPPSSSQPIFLAQTPYLRGSLK